MNAITNVLFAVANGLLVPVVILLLVLLLRALWLVACSFGEYARHLRQKRWLKPLLEESTPVEDESELKRFLPAVADTPLLLCLTQLVECHASAAFCERLLANYEVEAERVLGRTRLLVKMGPMLGLMGTLIPMGPALVGLSSGDLASMAYHMQMAFATTVVGLLVAAIGAVMLQVKQCWYAHDMNDLEYLYHRMAPEAIRQQGGEQA